MGGQTGDLSAGGAKDLRRPHCARSYKKICGNGAKTMDKRLVSYYNGAVVKKEDLPENIKEGDILDKINGKYTVNEEKTLEAKGRIKDKMKKLWNN